MESTAARRRPGLDGLRGLAALVVVVDHCLFLYPALANQYLDGATTAVGSPVWWMTYTPLHLLWAGREAVFLFFVLSGLVLSLPALRENRTPWAAYYPQRVVRLYLPVLAAVALALLLLVAVPRDAGPFSSWWLADHTGDVSAGTVVKAAGLLAGPTQINTALWSLQWEVLFSLLLPVFVLLAVGSRRLPALRWAAWVLVAATVVLAAPQTVLYLLMFGLGVAMARFLPRLDALGARFDGLPRVVRGLTVVVAVCLLLAVWLPGPGKAVGTVGHLANAVAVLGAGVLVWLFGCTQQAAGLTALREVRWLGRRSFSLYLVQEPVVVTVAYALHGTTNGALVLLVAMPVSLVLAEVFGRLVEMPAHRASRRVQAAVVARLPRRAAA